MEINNTMTFTAVRMRPFIFLPTIIFLVFCATAPAQTQTVEYFTLETEGFCWLQECEANDSIFHSPVVHLPEMGSNFPSHKSYDQSAGFYSNINPSIKPRIKLQSDQYFTQIAENQNFAFVEQWPKSNPEVARYDLFRNEDKGLGTKLLRASAITHTFQAINLILMIQFPDHFNYSISSWAEAKSNLKRAWTTSPVWDKDPWTTNFIGHPYVGSFYYNMLRSQGASPGASLLFSTGQSLIWEFVIEAVAEQPSIQDLLLTSTLGSVMGEFAHRATIRLNQNGFSTFEKILITFINPSYVINNGYRKRHLPYNSYF